MIAVHDFKLGKSRNMKIESNIPTHVKEFTYAKNSHYLKLIDDHGQETKLIEQKLIRYWCLSCSYIWYSADNKSSCCPCCQESKISQMWMKPQISLIPEAETNFEIKKEDKDE